MIRRTRPKLRLEGRRGAVRAAARGSRLRPAGAMVRVAPLAAALLLAGCATRRLTEPMQTATEQLLISTAIDHAVAKLQPHIPADAKVFVDTSYFDTGPPYAVLFPKYTIAAVRERLLRTGARLVDNKKEASVVAELRTGGQSIDHHTFLVGIPSFKVPIPLTSTDLSFPELALYKRDRQTGIAKLALTVYSRKTGALDSATGPQYGTSDHTRYTELLFFVSSKSDIAPQAVRAKEEEQ